MVVAAISVTARNFEMFKIPYSDFSVAVQSVSSLSALAQLVLCSQCGHTTELRQYRDYTICTATKHD